MMWHKVSVQTVSDFEVFQNCNFQITDAKPAVCVAKNKVNPKVCVELSYIKQSAL